MQCHSYIEKYIEISNLSSKLRSMSNWKIEILRGESSMLSPRLAFSYIFSPPTYNKVKILMSNNTIVNYKLKLLEKKLIGKRNSLIDMHTTENFHGILTGRLVYNVFKNYKMKNCRHRNMYYWHQKLSELQPVLLVKILQLLINIE